MSIALSFATWLPVTFIPILGGRVCRSPHLVSRVRKFPRPSASFDVAGFYGRVYAALELPVDPQYAVVGERQHLGHEHRGYAFLWVNPIICVVNAPGETAALRLFKCRPR